MAPRDLVLLHRLLAGGLRARFVATGTNGIISLRRLEGAGLAKTVDGEVQLTELALEALFG